MAREPREPWCIMARVETYLAASGDLVSFVHTIRCREQTSPWWAQTFGYQMVVRDSEIPDPPEIEPSQSNPRRDHDA